MTAPIEGLLEQLGSRDLAARESAALEIFRLGRAPADDAIQPWLADPEFLSLLGAKPEATVGVAVYPDRFAAIRAANDSPHLADVPPDQDAREFELHFPNGARLDVLTTREPRGSGAIARFLGKFGERVQQVEFRCDNVDRATRILKERFGVNGVYPSTRPGADGTRINFFLVPSPSGEKVLIELYEPATGE